jgi:ABC ATP binding cassette transporter
MIFDSFRLLVPQVFRYWREQRTYKTQVILGAFSAVIGILQYALLGMFLMRGGSYPMLDKYGGNLIGFLITGALGASALFVVMQNPKSSIQDEQRTGTLENIALSKGGIALVIATRLLIVCISTLVTTSLLIAAFFIFFSVSATINPVSLVFTVVVGFLLMSSIGLCSAGYILNSKSGEPFTWLITTATGLFSGVLFPVELYPVWIQKISLLIPTTSIMSALRMTSLTAISFEDTISLLVPALLWTLLLFPLGVLMFTWGLDRSRKKGTIGMY